MSTLGSVGTTPDRYIRGGNGERVLLSGVLVNEAYDTQESNFMIGLASGTDDGWVENIRVGTNVTVTTEEKGKRKTTQVLAPALSCYHATIPRKNFVAFYRRISGMKIVVLGTGSHTGTTNKKYRVQWAHGPETDIDLDQAASQGAPTLLPSPVRLDSQGNLT